MSGAGAEVLVFVVSAAVEETASISVHDESADSAVRSRTDQEKDPIVVKTHSGCWQGFRCDGNEERKDLLFRVERKLHKFNKTELAVFLGGENRDELVSDFKMKGFPFQKSCIIYEGNAIVAQTSFMYKLNQIFVERGMF